MATGEYLAFGTAPGYRQARAVQVFDRETKVSVEDLWFLQRDTKNVFAECTVPTLVRSLESDLKTKSLAQIFDSWDHRDKVDEVAPLLFQVLVTELMVATFEDELGHRLLADLLNISYFWLGRLQALLIGSDDSPWFDDVRTADVVETRDEIIRRAAYTTLNRLQPHCPGEILRRCRYGDYHTLQFENPAIANPTLGRWLGYGPFEVDGSGETIYRMGFPRRIGNDKLTVNHSATLRMVIDMADKHKITAVFAGGVVGKLFHSHYADRIEPFIDGRKEYLWFSDQAIDENTELVLRLVSGD